MNLRVSGLAPGRYCLTIEEQNISEFTAADFQAGINLAPLTTTPQHQTAAGILSGVLKEKRDLQATLRHLHSFRLSMLAVAKDYPEVLEIDREYPDAKLANRIRDLDVQRKKATGRNTGAWYGFITSQAKQHLQDLPKMRRRLQELRRQLEALPEERIYKYRLVKLNN